MDLPHARPIQVATEIEDAICIPAEDAIPVSAKTGLNVDQVLEAIVKKIPAPTGDPKWQPAGAGSSTRSTTTIAAS